MNRPAPAWSSLTEPSTVCTGATTCGVWEGSETHQQLFYDAIAQRRDDFGAAGYVAVSSDPAEITARWPWIRDLDARAARRSPARANCSRRYASSAPERPPLLLFDSLAPMADRWGMRIASASSGTAARCCSTSAR